MRISGIIKNSIVNGEGIRDVVFLQGCEHKCCGCHNPHTWDKNGGEYFTPTELANLFKDSSFDITISGGEPLLQYSELIEFLEILNKRAWLYTGFKYEQIPPEMLKTLSKWVDVLVDGRFEIDKKDKSLLFRGSSNQRLIDLPKSIKENKIISWEDIQ